VEIHVVAPVAAEGWVCDFAALDAAWEPLRATLDHQCLNEVCLKNPTSENLARWIWVEIGLPGLARVVVRETVRSGCEYEGD
jgi:6-pyruvoyltetrahydropterin/6-carboxytetrahydropterin synthase